MNNAIGQRIKERRKQLNITQTQIQEQTSISSGNLSCIENGKYLPSATALVELAQILNCSVDWILTGEYKITTNSENSNNSNEYTLSQDEYSLIQLYRLLPDNMKDDVINFISYCNYKSIQQGKSKEETSIPFQITKNDIETA